MWLLMQKRIQCRTVLFKKHVVDNTTCEICREAEETLEHIIWGCRLGHDLWQRLNMPSMISAGLNSLHTINPSDGVPMQEFLFFITLVCWQIWKTRNATVFRNESHSVDQVLNSCKAATEQWRHRLSRKKKHIANAWCSIFVMARQGQG
jgi:hypothetical protein